MATERMQFIPALREKVLDQLEREVPPMFRCSRDDLERALDNWQAGKDPVGPLEAGCWEGFERVQREVMGGGA